MGFLLTMAEGKEAGREFVFAQPSVTIGRISECDIVLYDPGVSRKHARIFAMDGAYYVEDLGSSNGTKVNGVLVTQQRLSPHDALALGPVVFRFSPDEEAGEDDATRGGGVEHESTRITTRPQKPALALVPAGADDEDLDALGRHITEQSETGSPLRPRPSRGGAARPLAANGSGASRVSSPRMAARRRDPDLSGTDPGEDLPDDDESTGAGVPPDISPRGRRAPARRPLSAAERARFRREHPGLGGRLHLFWLEASPLVRVLTAAAVAVVVLMLVVGVSNKMLGESGPALPAEATRLGREPVPFSFGLGPRVDYERPDMKAFDFEFASATRAVVLLHFQSEDIAEGEVSVSVNGSSVGFVPADTVNSAEVPHEIILPPNRLKSGEGNQVVFDNVKNPPGNESWRISRPWVEIVLLPEGIPPTQMRKQAEASFSRAQLAFERRDVGAPNRYEAWREFRSAWLLLEGHPDPKPELYLLSRDQMRRAQQELDRTCAKLVLEVQRSLTERDLDAVRSTLEHIRDYFPNRDQPCHFKPDEIRADLDL